MRKSINGFTIVELLIVIVVIAILATISVIAYTGIQNRANDAAIKSDLSNFAKKLQVEYSALGNPYPAGGGARANSAASNTGDGVLFNGFNFRANRKSYASDVGANLVYCTAPDSNNKPAFIIRAKSKSGIVFEFNSTVGNIEIYATGGNIPLQSESCDPLVGWPRSWSYGYYSSSWRTWTE